MANPLLARVTPELLARKRQTIETVEKLATFERLAAIVDDDLKHAAAGGEQRDFRARPVRISLRFDWADATERLPRVAGRVETEVPATCQRCLGFCEVELVADVDLLLLDPRDAVSVDEALEVWELDDERLRPLDVVEEMLVMALPFAAVHRDAQQCGRVADYGGNETGDTVRPFADLKSKLGRSV